MDKLIDEKLLHRLDGFATQLRATGSHGAADLINEAADALTEYAQRSAEAEPVATKLVPDPYDERSGIWFSAADLKRLNDLPAGTKLYTSPQPTPSYAAGMEAAAKICEGLRKDGYHDVRYGAGKCAEAIRQQAANHTPQQGVFVPLSEKAKRKGFHAFIKAMGSEMPRNDDGTYNGSFSHAILVAHYAMLAAAKEQK